MGDRRLVAVGNDECTTLDNSHCSTAANQQDATCKQSHQSAIDGIEWPDIDDQASAVEGLVTKLTVRSRFKGNGHDQAEAAPIAREEIVRYHRACAREERVEAGHAEEHQEEGRAGTGTVEGVAESPDFRGRRGP